ncbi:hypothetical protein HHI36_022051 [Cryptolaemus montrouzieri]|uniref:Uncharacterized protein n=1 Tax=Cryptolaemus montrouzieri TaxID=559131 RepID=A0ABD2MYW1_9CUCU
MENNRNIANKFDKKDSNEILRVHSDTNIGNSVKLELTGVKTEALDQKKQYFVCETIEPCHIQKQGKKKLKVRKIEEKMGVGSLSHKKVFIPKKIIKANSDTNILHSLKSKFNDSKLVKEEKNGGLKKGILNKTKQSFVHETNVSCFEENENKKKMRVIKEPISLGIRSKIRDNADEKVKNKSNLLVPKTMVKSNFDTNFSPSWMSKFNDSKRVKVEKNDDIFIHKINVSKYEDEDYICKQQQNSKINQNNIINNKFEQKEIKTYSKKKSATVNSYSNIQKKSEFSVSRTLSKQNHETNIQGNVGNNNQKEGLYFSNEKFEAFIGKMIKEEQIDYFDCSGEMLQDVTKLGFEDLENTEVMKEKVKHYDDIQGMEISEEKMVSMNEKLCIEDKSAKEIFWKKDNKKETVAQFHAKSTQNNLELGCENTPSYEITEENILKENNTLLNVDTINSGEFLQKNDQTKEMDTQSEITQRQEDSSTNENIFHEKSSQSGSQIDKNTSKFNDFQTSHENVTLLIPRKKEVHFIEEENNFEHLGLENKQRSEVSEENYTQFNVSKEFLKKNNHEKEMGIQSQITQRQTELDTNESNFYEKFPQNETEIHKNISKFNDFQTSHENVTLLIPRKKEVHFIEEENNFEHLGLENKQRSEVSEENYTQFNVSKEFLKKNNHEEEMGIQSQITQRQTELDTNESNFMKNSTK